MVGLRSHLPNFHAVEHIVLHTVNFEVPTLVEVTVEPVAKRMTPGIEIGVEVIHTICCVPERMVSASKAWAKISSYSPLYPG